MSASAAAPRASLLLLAYNQERYAEEAARSCLAQESEPLEIVFSDDASSDRTHDILRSVAADYRGPHRVVVRRNETNLGITGHYNRLVEESCGELLITAAADDTSHRERAARLLAAWDATGGRADLISSHLVDVDAAGVEHGVLKVDDLAASGGVDGWLRHRPFIIGAGHAFTRRMMRAFGPLDPAIHHEDQIMVFRALAWAARSRSTRRWCAIAAAAHRRRRRAARSRRAGLANPPPAPGDRRARATGARCGRRRLRRRRDRRVRAAAPCARTICSRLYDADSALGRLQALFMAGGPRRPGASGSGCRPAPRACASARARRRGTGTSAG